MAKFFAILFLLITTSGMVIPCCSVDDCCADQVISATQQDTHEDEGTCSPFFACSTCVGFIKNTMLPELNTLVVSPIQHQPRHNDLVPSRHVYLPWQPPRAFA